MSRSLYPAGAYWFYAVCAALAAVLGVTVLPETKVGFGEHFESINTTFQGKTLADVSQYFYVCCTFAKSKDRGQFYQVEETARSMTSSASILKKPVTISREETSAEQRQEKRVKRITLDLSHLDSSQQEILQESENLIRTKSAPVVTLKELEELL